MKVLTAKTVLAAAAVALCLAAQCCYGITAAVAAPASARTYAVETDGIAHRGRLINTYRPHKFWVDTGGPFLSVSGLTWHRWSRTSALGYGNAAASDSGRFSLGRVEVRFYHATYSAYYREWYFARMHITGGHKFAAANYWRWHWGDKEWLPCYSFETRD